MSKYIVINTENCPVKLNGWNARINALIAIIRLRTRRETVVLAIAGRWKEMASLSQYGDVVSNAATPSSSKGVFELPNFV